MYREGAVGRGGSFGFEHLFSSGFPFGQRRGAGPFHRRFQALDFYARNSPAVHFNNSEAQAIKIETLAAARDETKPGEHEAAHGRIGTVFWQDDVVLRFEIAQAEGSVKDHR